MDSINESLPSPLEDGDGEDEGEVEGDSGGVSVSEENTTLRKEKYVRSQSRVRSESYHKYLAEDSVGDENMDAADELDNDEDDDITVSDSESLVSVEEQCYLRAIRTCEDD